MHILNQSTNVHNSKEEAFITWIHHSLSDGMAQKNPVYANYRMSKLKYPMDDNEHSVYIIQWLFETSVVEDDAMMLIDFINSSIFKEFGDSVIAFCTLMEMLPKE